MVVETWSTRARGETNKENGSGIGLSSLSIVNLLVFFFLFVFIKAVQWGCIVN